MSSPRTSSPSSSGQGFPGRIRIVAGSRRGRLIRVPAGAVRPTSEMVRGAVFNALGPLGGLAALDLFAGSGALGLEALSRGAGSCVFVEADPSVAATLRENVSVLDYESVARVIVADYRKAVEGFVAVGRTFDLLFVDPPYRILSGVEEALTPHVASLLTESGVAVIEGDRSSQTSLGLIPVFSRTYGDTKITMVTTSLASG